MTRNTKGDTGMRLLVILFSLGVVVIGAYWLSGGDSGIFEYLSQKYDSLSESPSWKEHKARTEKGEPARARMAENEEGGFFPFLREGSDSSKQVASPEGGEARDHLTSQDREDLSELIDGL